jgi:hypothetical protein
MTEPVSRIEIELLKDLIKEQREELKNLRIEVRELHEAILEIRIGKKWLWGLLGAAAVFGGLIDTALKLLKVY